MDVSYTPHGAALLISLVVLQRQQGVDFETAVSNANRAIAEYLRKHGQHAVELDEVVSLMDRVSSNR